MRKIGGSYKSFHTSVKPTQPESCVDNFEVNSVSCDWFCGKVIKTSFSCSRCALTVVKSMSVHLLH